MFGRRKPILSGTMMEAVIRADQANRLAEREYKTYEHMRGGRQSQVDRDRQAKIAGWTQAEATRTGIEATMRVLLYMVTENQKPVK